MGFFKKLLPLEDKLWKPKEVGFKFQVVAVGPGAEDGRVEVVPLDAWLANAQWFAAADTGVEAAWSRG